MAIDLTKEEIYFLRLLAHNYNSRQIADFLNLKTHNKSLFESNLKIKMNCSNSFQMIQKGFEKGILNKADYAEDSIKRIANLYSHSLYKSFRSGKELPKNIERFYLVRFLDFCKKMDEKGVGKTLNDEDINYLNTQYNKMVFKKSHAESLFINSTKKGNVFKKLGANCWYTAFKYCFRTGYLKNNLEEVYKDTLTQFYEYELRNILNDNQLGDKSKRFILHGKFIEFYIDFEHILFHRNKLSLECFLYN